MNHPAIHVDNTMHSHSVVCEHLLYDSNDALGDYLDDHTNYSITEKHGNTFIVYVNNNNLKGLTKFMSEHSISFTTDGKTYRDIIGSINKYSKVLITL